MSNKSQHGMASGESSQEASKGQIESKARCYHFVQGYSPHFVPIAKSKQFPLGALLMFVQILNMFKDKRCHKKLIYIFFFFRIFLYKLITIAL